MKSALLLSGIVGGTAGKDGRGVGVNYEVCAQLFKKNVIDINDCDVFLHSWSTEHRQNLVRLYQPKKYTFESQIDFSNCAGKDLEATSKAATFCLCSKWHSIKETILQKIQQEKETGQRYDWVMIGRFDLMMLKKVNFCKLLHNELIYFAPLCFHPKSPRDNKKRGRWEIPPQRNASIKRRMLHDLFFIGSSKAIDKFLKFKRNITGAYNIHKVLWNDVKKHIGEPREVAGFYGWRGQEFDLYRWRICHSLI